MDVGSLSSERNSTYVALWQVQIKGTQKHVHRNQHQI